MQTRILLPAFVAATILASPRVGGAGDVKVYAGTGCLARFQHEIHRASGTLRPSPDGSLGEYFCPIVRDNQTNKTGFKAKAWIARANLEPSGIQSGCSIGIRHLNSFLELEYESRAVPPSNDAIRKVHELDWGTSISTGAVDAVYFMECLMRKGSELLGYRIDEP